MLNQDVNTIQLNPANEIMPHLPFAQSNGSAPVNTAVAVAPANTGIAPIGQMVSAYSSLKHVFRDQLGLYVLPPDATTGCTIMGSAIKFGDDMKQDAGDFLVIRPLNYTPYEKVSISAAPTAEEKKLEVSCFDGQTVTFEEQTYTKAEYLALLREKGYSKAAFKDRCVLHGQYITCDRANKVELSEDKQLFAIYLSPSSYKAFQGFLINQSISGSALMPIKLGKVGKSMGSSNWTQFTFERYLESVPEAA